MTPVISYEKAKSCFDYLGKHYSGDVICNDKELKTYWFVFDQIDVKPFGGSIEFMIINGQLESVKAFPTYKLFVLCVKGAIDKYRKEQGN